MLHHLALGSNLGDRGTELAAALAAMGRLGQVRAFSPTFETAPLGPSTRPYLNAAAALESTLEPPSLLDELLAIERGLGRVRGERWGDRLIDLDLLLSGDRVIDTPGCRVPHPELAARGFVLAPLVAIAADVVVPTTRATVRALFDAWLRRDGRGVVFARDPAAPPPFGHDLSPFSACRARFSASL